LIAAFPTREREASRLLVVRRDTGELVHTLFCQLGEFLTPGDLLVVNDTKVFPARLWGRKESGGRVEVLMLEPFPENRQCWIAMADASPPLGTWIRFGKNLTAKVVGNLGQGRFGLEFQASGNLANQLDSLGEPPVPPYVSRLRGSDPLDWDRYQTVYATHSGAVAAPTAGFHFTPELFARLQKKGIEKATLTLHVGPGTFQPVRQSEIRCHHMEGERYVLSAAAARAVCSTKQKRRRVVAVGTTSTRTLEWVALQKGKIQADTGIARLYICPGDSFRVIDALITNFHLPGSTPLILVAAFAGLELVKYAYAEAIRLQYRFYSYGDAMLIL
ncbi:MAG TPA: tRNA preQ1(34) S-adenosylmethionine ribosyltransferase-isomerase QueA, partial [Terriglobales bacterium]|nr:tRNA preQ1(34) S-adenosylmethionine ribosyltransferase-isomerase QueA [Terriglobales bacterium]